MKNNKKILSFFLSVFLILNLFGNAFAEGETGEESGTEVGTETKVEENNSIPVIANDPRVTVRAKKVITINRKEVEDKKKIIVYDLKNWPFKHKLEETTKKKYHKPSWMYVENKDFVCEKGESYFVVTKDGKKVGQLSLNCEVEFDDKKKNTEFAEEVLKGTDSILGENYNKELNSTEEVEGKNLSEEEKTDEKVNEEGEGEGEGEVEDFMENLFGTKIKLRNVSISNEKLYLSGNRMATSIKAYSLEKEELEISKFKIEGLKNKNYYNGIVANLFSKFERKTKLNSSKEEIAKSISKVSFSFSSYVNENLDDNIRDIFRKKLVSDLKELQVSYSKLKNKDKKVSSFLLNRG